MYSILRESGGNLLNPAALMKVAALLTTLSLRIGKLQGKEAGKGWMLGGLARLCYNLRSISGIV
jgi:hypothetical protein